jgi:hypothetical protein
MTSQIDEVIKWVTSMVGQINTNDDVVSLLEILGIYKYIETHISSYRHATYGSLRPGLISDLFIATVSQADRYHFLKIT